MCGELWAGTRAFAREVRRDPGCDWGRAVGALEAASGDGGLVWGESREPAAIMREI